MIYEILISSSGIALLSIGGRHEGLTYFILGSLVFAVGFIMLLGNT
jgi:hypothetical protein